MVDVRRVKLPGVGMLHTFVTDDGGKVGVITHRSGHSDLITFSDAEDGADVKKVSLRLDEDEAHTLAELLGGTRITESLSRLDQVPGLSIDWFTVDYDDDIAGKKLSSMRHSSANWGRVLPVTDTSSSTTPGTARPMIAPAVAIRWSS